MSCYNCKDRIPSCHATCERYKAYKSKINKANKKRREETDFDKYLYGAMKTMKEKRGVMRI